MSKSHIFEAAEKVPTAWYNINADLPMDLPLPLPNETDHAIADDGTYPKEIIETAFLSKDRWIPIPEEIWNLYRSWRPTPLLRAERLEKKLNTPAKLYFKYEGASPCGSHKLNGSIPQAYYARKEGFTGIATPTGGQWGTAFAWSCRLFGFDPVIFMMRQSACHRPARIDFMNLLQGNVIISPSFQTAYGRSILKNYPDHPGSLAIATSEVREFVAERPGYSHARGELLHQTVSGIEAKEQLDELGEYPDVIIACTGFGSNFSGIAFPFFMDILNGESRPDIIAVEPKAVPVFSDGEFKYDYADSMKSTVRIKAYTLGCEYNPPPIHAGGLRFGTRNTTMSALYDQRLFSVLTYTERESLEAGLEFMRAEGVVPATESAYAIKAAIDKAIECREERSAKTILTNLSGNGYFDLLAYQELVDGLLPNAGY